MKSRFADDCDIWWLALKHTVTSTFMEEVIVRSVHKQLGERGSRNSSSVGCEVPSDVDVLQTVVVDDRQTSDGGRTLKWELVGHGHRYVPTQEDAMLRFIS